MTTNCILAQAPVTRRVRAYFAPVDRATKTPVFFDPASPSTFLLDSPPSPWIDLGWVQQLSRQSLSKSKAVLTGNPASTLEQVRETLEAQVSLEFLSWSKLTMALATGSQHMNVLACANGVSPSADGGQAATAILVELGATSSVIPLAAVELAKFAPGEMIAVDSDYAGQTGFVGWPVSGAYVRRPLTDVDYVRRITFNVAVISQVTSNGLLLAQPLPGGIPQVGAKLQKICGFVDREGGSFFQEWSGLFILEGTQGDRICFHYPRLQTIAEAREGSVLLDSKHKDGLERIVLKGHFMALPVTDALDGERVLSYRSFQPANHALI